MVRIKGSYSTNNIDRMLILYSISDGIHKLNIEDLKSYINEIIIFKDPGSEESKLYILKDVSNNGYMNYVVLSSIDPGCVFSFKVYISKVANKSLII
jgi:hypothetical protein